MLAVIGGVLVGIVSVLEEILPTETVVWSWKGLWPHLPLSLLMGSMLGILTEAIYKLGLPFFFLCIASLTLGEGYFAIQEIRKLGKLDIQYWWENRRDQRMEVLRFVLIVVLTTSLSTGFFIWFGSGLRSVQFLEQLYGTQYAQNIVCTFAGSLFGLVYGLLKSLHCSKLDERTFVRPNQGIKHSLQNSLVAGCIVFLLFGLIYYFFFALFIRMYSLNMTYILFIDAMIAGAVFGLIAAFVIGGDACIKHSILRLLLWQAKHIPWNYSHFLDYATERILLRKVGGGYIFIHRLLLEYFASK